ncbi:hypothetical protein KEM09_05160 [Carboxylicivirga mesophila]|uniref:Uncharacterized protein n=2 Tax=Carboxylicivirga TaxID=1628153 RepID=A0A941IYS6_9BACT|nr:MULTISPECIES: hypothetical protein [Carboxylicivirga]MBR8536097.1 hypothetical protein [Carboxylicivirga sediminis]MBS2210775.1 hypothetical protein [Carboxylicivirga mesophila]
MYNAINEINKSIEILLLIIDMMKEEIKSDNFEELSRRIENEEFIYDIDDCDPTAILSALETIFFSLQSKGGREVVEDIYIKRIETDLIYVLVHLIRCSRRVDAKVSDNPDNDIYIIIKEYIDDFFCVVEEISDNVQYFYRSILGVDIELNPFESLKAEKVTFKDVCGVIGYTENRITQMLNDSECKFIEAFDNYCRENKIMDVSRRQLKELAVYKYLSGRSSKKIAFNGTHTDIFRVANIFKLDVAKANTVFDNGKGKMTNNHNPKNNVNTPLDEFFKTQYNLHFKDKASDLLSFEYCLPIK